MAIALDVANVGRGNNGGGGITSCSLTTSSAVASGARIFLCLSWQLGGGTPVFSSMTAAGGLTWTLEAQIGDGALGDSSGAALIYADAPAGLASSTTLTASWTGTAFAAVLLGSSYTGITGTRTAEGTDRVGTTTTWTSPTIAVGAGGIVIGICANDNSPQANTPTAPAVEDNDFANPSELIYGVIERRIEASAGSYNVAGTLTTAPGVNNAIVVASYEATASVTPGPGDNPPIGIAGRGAGW